MNTPLDRALAILDQAGAVAWAADLVEDGDARDADAAKYRDYVPAWHGLSRGGEVEGELLYVNYGTKEDYEDVLAKGGNLTGKIVLARYGVNFRGLKVRVHFPSADSYPHARCPLTLTPTPPLARSNSRKNTARRASSSTRTRATTGP